MFDSVWFCQHKLSGWAKIHQQETQQKSKLYSSSQIDEAIGMDLDPWEAVVCFPTEMQELGVLIPIWLVWNTTSFSNSHPLDTQTGILHRFS